jgi:hypothetical protein
MAEAGEPEPTMLDIMGHMSTAMLRRYAHIRQAANVETMQAAGGVPEESLSLKVTEMPLGKSA